ncbi:hypothetical protein AOA61_22990, partial [Pseudomonas sp. 2995-1]
PNSFIFLLQYFFRSLCSYYERIKSFISNPQHVITTYRFIIKFLGDYTVLISPVELRLSLVQTFQSNTHRFKISTVSAYFYERFLGYWVANSKTSSFSISFFKLLLCC